MQISRDFLRLAVNESTRVFCKQIRTTWKQKLYFIFMLREGRHSRPTTSSVVGVRSPTAAAVAVVLAAVAAAAAAASVAVATVVSDRRRNYVASV
jgi:hypothetical protein